MIELCLSYVPGRPKIAYENRGAGQTVVFLHGIAGNRRIWRRQLAALAGEFRVASWDARGYGDSDDEPVLADFGDFSVDLLRMLDHLGVARAHIVGQSMGGRIAQDFYMMNPQRVASLVLCGTFSGHEPEKSPAARAEWLSARREPLLAGRTPADLAPMIAGNILAPDARAEIRAELQGVVAMLRGRSYLNAIEAMVGYQRKSDLAAIRVPTLVICGAEDRISPPPISRTLAAGIARASYLEIPRAGHMTCMEAPEIFNRALLDFLRRQADSAG